MKIYFVTSKIIIVVYSKQITNNQKHIIGLT